MREVVQMGAIGLGLLVAGFLLAVGWSHLRGTRKIRRLEREKKKVRDLALELEQVAREILAK